jgi:hypothetical protein
MINPLAPHTGRRRASLAGLLAFIAAVAVATAWFHEESRWDSRWAVLTLGGFALAAAIVTLRSRSLTDASIRLAVGAAVLLVSVAFTRIHAETAGWHYRSVFHWAAYWALATVALPMLLGPGLRRRWAAAGREKWVERLRQVPAGFLLFLLAILLSSTIDYVLSYAQSAMGLPPPPFRVGGGTIVTIPPPPPRPQPAAGMLPVITRPPN